MEELIKELIELIEQKEDALLEEDKERLDYDIYNKKDEIKKILNR